MLFFTSNRPQIINAPSCFIIRTFFFSARTKKQLTMSSLTISSLKAGFSCFISCSNLHARKLKLFRERFESVAQSNNYCFISSLNKGKLAKIDTLSLLGYFMSLCLTSKTISPPCNFGESMQAK